LTTGVLRRTFVPKRQEVAGVWRRLHNVHASPNIIIKSKSMRWVGHVAYRVLVIKPEEIAWKT
jgi:hypothetical protein